MKHHNMKKRPTLKKAYCQIHAGVDYAIDLKDCTVDQKYYQDCNAIIHWNSTTNTYNVEDEPVYYGAKTFISAIMLEILFLGLLFIF